MPACHTETDIDGFVALDIELLQCNFFGGIWPLASNAARGMLSFCISDTVKQMLLNHSDFIPHLLDGLLLQPEHPRQGSDPVVKAAVQRDFAECIQQISLFPPGCDALRAHSGMVEALDALVELAWSEEAKDCVRGALMQMAERPPEPIAGGGGGGDDDELLHIMVSCKYYVTICQCSGRTTDVVYRKHSPPGLTDIYVDRTIGSVSSTCPDCAVLSVCAIVSSQTNGMSNRSSRGSWRSCSTETIWCGSIVRA